MRLRFRGSLRRIGRGLKTPRGAAFFVIGCVLAMSLSAVRHQAAHSISESNGAAVAAPAAAGASGEAGATAAPAVKSAPATPTQVETIAKLARSVGRTVSTDGLTRAAASELITRLSEERYGARRAP